MTRKHFDAIATVINGNVQRASGPKTLEAVCDVAEGLIPTFLHANPNFNYKMFQKACGYEIRDGKYRKL